jgi:TolB-like protein
VLVDVSPDDVREQLERILGSEAFAGAGRHSRVLRYLIERTLAGDGDQLKEYVLGTEVFDRPDSYDPRIDSIVRVEVRRLRTRLEDYYRGPGARDAVIITIPRGAYVPVFSGQVAQAAAAEPDPASASTETAMRTSSSFPPIAVGVLVAVGLAVGTLLLSSGQSERASASTRPGIAVLPFAHYSTLETDALIAAHLTDAVTTELARVGGLSVASRTSAGRYRSEGQSISAIVDALNVNFVMEARAVVTDGRVRVSARLVDGVLDRKMWVGDYDFAAADVPSAARQIAVEAAAAALDYLSR